MPPLTTPAGLYLPQHKPPIGTFVEQRHPLASGLVGAWLFNEGSAAVYNAGYGAEAESAVIGASTNPFWRVGRLGSELVFNGAGAGQTNQRIVVTTDARYSLQSHTLVAWVHTESVASLPVNGSAFSILSRSDDITVGGYEWAINYNSGSPRFAFAYFDGSVQGWFLDSTTMATGTDYLLAGVWVPSTVTFYVNGVLSSSVGTGSSAISNASTHSLRLASQSTAQNSPFEGAIQQLLLYNRALSAGEIAELAAEPFVVYRPRSVWRILDLAVSAGGTTYPLSGSVTQAQSVSLVRAVQLVRALTITQVQTLALSKQVGLVRSVTQAQTLALVKQISLTRAVTQAQAVSIAAQKVFLVARSVTQAQAVALVRQLNFIRSVTQSQTVLTLGKQPQLIRSVAQSQTALTLGKAIGKVVSLAQAQTLSIARAVRLARTLAQTEALTYSVVGGHTYLLTRSVTQSQAVSVTFTQATLPGPVGTAVFSRPPDAGSASSNYPDWPVLIVHPGEPAPPVGGAIGGP